MTGSAPSPMFDVAGNRLRMLTDGSERLDALLHLIDTARRSLRLLFYIYVDDRSGRRIRDALIAAAARGVTVSLIVDGLGSEPAVGRDFFDPVRRAGGTVCVFLPRIGRRFLLRNHQKLAIADDARAIVGGFNVEDSYFGTVADGAWRDLGLVVEGPAAGRLSGYLDELAAWIDRPGAHLRTLSKLLKRWSERKGAVRWLLGGPSRHLSPWARTVRYEMQTADRIDIVAGYFAPGPLMLRRMDKAARRGLLRIVLPAKTDHAIALLGQRFTYRNLTRNETQLYEYQPTKLHTKLFVVDDTVHIGSANFDVRSMFLNMEVMLRIEDAAFAAHVREYFEGEVAQSCRITAERNTARSGWWTRIKQAGAYFVMMMDVRVTRGLNSDH